MNNLLLSFVGDDFTGSTDAMESLARSGVRTALFTEPPTDEQLAKYPGLRAFGIAALTRSLPAEEMEQALRPIFQSLRQTGAPIVHYKVCSTFDSSPAVGSIGRVIDVGMEAFGSRFVPVVVGAPDLGRYCVFGNLFARCGSESEPYRLDRHPSMSRHPVTPMDEADLRRHLARQTSKSIGLLDLLQLESPAATVRERFDAMVASGQEVMLIDTLYPRHLMKIGQLLAEKASERPPLFVVGSSGVESALCAHWKDAGVIAGEAAFAAPAYVGPIVVVCGSCSPVTAQQIDWAAGNGFAMVELSVHDLLSENVERAMRDAIASAASAVNGGHSVVIRTGASRTAGVEGADRHRIGISLGKLLRRLLENVAVRRLLIAGGDTSSQVARALGIAAVEMIGELTRGSPLCCATAPDSPADGVQITFKGGQIGAVDFFGSVEA
ncbi:MAG TPA: four-carbon acid sugar kinase family protein, partial [Tepidisphaeraceae bacterium]|nr:four-carbon acid sugar kinase family protein [Tepidisphaeraceae bacterium]